MIKLMLDTNMLIYIIKQKPYSVLEKFKQYKPENIGISSIVYAEMIYGVYNSQYPQKNLISLHALVDNFQILEFEKTAAKMYGKIKAQLKSQGTPISDNDLLIGSHALSLKLPLVTNNTREYTRISGLHLENWT